MTIQIQTIQVQTIKYDNSNTKIQILTIQIPTTQIRTIQIPTTPIRTIQIPTTQIRIIQIQTTFNTNEKKTQSRGVKLYIRIKRRKQRL